MPLTDAGATFIASAITNDGPPTFFDTSNAHIAVGSSTAVFDKTDTTLTTELSQGRKVVSSAPSITANAIELVTTFATGDANGAWQEWGVFNASSAGTMLSRKVDDLGTKTSAQSWQITVTLTVTAP